MSSTDGASGPELPDEAAQGEEEPGSVEELAPLATWVRVLLLVSGWLLILLGLAGLVLPGLQGILLLILGAAVLSLVSASLNRWLDRRLRPFPKVHQRHLAFRRKLHGWLSRGR